MAVLLIRTRLTDIRRYLVHIHQYLSMKANDSSVDYFCSLTSTRLSNRIYLISCSTISLSDTSRVDVFHQSVGVRVCWCLPIRARHVFTSMSVGAIVFIHSTFVHIYSRDQNLSASTARSYLDILHVWSTRHNRDHILRCIETSREYFHISSCLHMDWTDIRWCLKHRRTRLWREENEHWRGQTMTTSIITHFKSRFTND